MLIGTLDDLDEEILQRAEDSAGSNDTPEDRLASAVLNGLRWRRKEVQESFEEVFGDDKNARKRFIRWVMKGLESSVLDALPAEPWV